jgi:RNA polymerase sporulation-specific sigma factor
MNKNDFTDEELVRLAQENDSTASNILIERYKSLATARARSYFLIGGEEQDLIQEGMIAIFNAINSFSGKSNFKNYVFTCINNRILTVIKTFSRMKNQPLNNYISLSGCVDGDLDKTDIIIDASFGPEERLINGESVRELHSIINNALSKYELTILSYYLNGDTYAVISNKLNKDIKSIDNALQRIRKKLRNALNVSC